MSYDWYDEIDQLVWHFEGCVEDDARGRGMLGMAPSAGDEARARLRQVAQAVSPRELVDEAENLSGSEVKATAAAIAKAAVDKANARGSRHVTRDDVSAAIDAMGSYPFTR